MDVSNKFVDFYRYCNVCKHKNLPDTAIPCDECITTACRNGTYRPEKFERDEKLWAHRGLYTSIRKIKPYLFETKYNHIYYDKAYDFYKKDAGTPVDIPMCSAVRNGDFYGRNFDWYYSNQAEFIVRTPHTDRRYAVLGVAGGFKELTDNFVSSGAYSDLYSILPFQLQDGINEHGLVMSINVVPSDYGFNETIPDKETFVKMSALMLIRFVLDKFDDAFKAARYIRDHVSVYFPKSLHDKHYECHFMIADKDKTYAIEFINHRNVIIDISNKPYMTNFHLYNIHYNNDGSVYTPETQNGELNAIDFNRITPNGSGLERYNIIANWYNNIHIVLKNSVRDLLKDLAYTKAYLSSGSPSNPYWYTEFTGVNDLVVNSQVEDFTETISSAADYYSERTRDNPNTWHTMHSSIYDMNSKTLYLETQEDDEEITFKFA